METRSYRLKDNRKKEKRLSYNLNMLHPRKLLFGEIFAIDIQLLWIRPFRKNGWLVTTTEKLDLGNHLLPTCRRLIRFPSCTNKFLPVFGEHDRFHKSRHKLGSLREGISGSAGHVSLDVIPGNLQGNVVETVRRVHPGGHFK